MLKKQSKHQSKVFRDFKALNRLNHHSVVRFYDEYKNEIPRLDFHEGFILHLSYATALHETGQYERHIKEADSLIETSILNNIQYYQGEDVFLKMLSQKAQSLYFLEKYEEAQHVLKELIRLSPNNKNFPKYLKNCLTKHKVVYSEYLQAAGVLTVLLSAVLLIINLLVIENFYATYQYWFSIFFNITFFSGGLLLFSGLIIQRFMVHNKVKKFQQEAKKRHELKQQQ